jgi:hypothetical protein
LLSSENPIREAWKFLMDAHRSLTSWGEGEDDEVASDTGSITEYGGGELKLTLFDILPLLVHNHYNKPPIMASNCRVMGHVQMLYMSVPEIPLLTASVQVFTLYWGCTGPISFSRLTSDWVMPKVLVSILLRRRVSLQPGMSMVHRCRVSSS